MNTPEELAEQPHLQSFLLSKGLKTLSVPPTSRQSPFLPNLRGCLEALCDIEGSKFIAIVNADIILDFSWQDLDPVRQADATSFFVAHRSDIVDLESRDIYFASRCPGNGFNPCRNGLDLFIAHRDLWSKSLKYLSPDLTLGLPWWDLVLPVALLAAGGRMHHLDYRKVLHIIHEQRAWGTSSFNQMGRAAIHHIRKELSNDNSSSVAMLWLSAIEWSKAKQATPLSKLKRLKLRLGRYRRGIWGEPLSDWLSETAKLTQNLIGHGASEPYWPINCTREY